MFLDDDTELEVSIPKFFKVLILLAMLLYVAICCYMLLYFAICCFMVLDDLILKTKNICLNLFKQLFYILHLMRLSLRQRKLIDFKSFYN